eukprot:scaffold109651_cov17-Tisochrysis_lutea.AAC.2
MKGAELWSKLPLPGKPHLPQLGLLLDSWPVTTSAGRGSAGRGRVGRRCSSPGRCGHWVGQTIRCGLGKALQAKAKLVAGAALEHLVRVRYTWRLWPGFSPASEASVATEAGRLVPCRQICRCCRISRAYMNKTISNDVVASLDMKLSRLLSMGRPSIPFSSSCVCRGHGHNEPKEEAEGGDGDEDCRATGAQASSSPHAGAGSRGGGGGGEGHCSTSCQQGGCQREDYVQQKFSGHRNSQTVKIVRELGWLARAQSCILVLDVLGVNFFGASDEYVISGSDCGHIFIWQKRDGELKKLLR